MNNKVCPHYTGVACIDGHCPNANAAQELGELIIDCSECIYFLGGEDCAFYHDVICDGQCRKDCEDGYEE